MPVVSRAQRPWRLETVLRLVVAGIFLAGGITMVILLNRHDREEALDEARERAALLLARNLATHEYFTRELKPAIFRLTEATLPPGYFDPTWMSSTYAVRRMQAYLREKAPDPQVATYYYDVVMPGMGGAALVERLRAARPELPALFLSGYTADALPKDLPGRLLLKPYRRDELARAVAELLSGEPA